jgi:hypothetical protein
MSPADLLPRVRGILPLTDIDALNRLTRTPCDVLEDRTGCPTCASQCGGCRAGADPDGISACNTAGPAKAGNGCRAYGTRAHGSGIVWRGEARPPTFRPRWYFGGHVIAGTNQRGWRASQPMFDGHVRVLA